jgi:hypothetical protein
MSYLYFPFYLGVKVYSVCRVETPLNYVLQSNSVQPVTKQQMYCQCITPNVFPLPFLRPFPDYFSAILIILLTF